MSDMCHWNGLSRRTVLLFAVAMLVCTQPLIAQSVPAPSIQRSPASAKLREYEVVSIKENKSDEESSSWQSTTDGFRIVNSNLIYLVAEAYGVRFDLVSGAPTWLSTRRFDVEAKVAGSDVEAYKKLNDKDHLPMVKALLRERLGLQAHIETKELPVYDLVVSKEGLKMKLAPPDPPQSDTAETSTPDGKSTSPVRHNGTSSVGWGSWSGTDLPMQQIASQLSYLVHHKIVDKTGLTGKYDFELKWTPEEDGAQQDNGTDTAPSIFTALQEHLGLKLRSTKGPVDTLVIDHVDLPSEN
jgi:uncharacterized protein (TIGR03435 family)